MSNYAKVANAERAMVKRLMEEEGGYACRTAGSHSPFDVIHIRRGRARVFQLKKGGRSPFDGFGPREREAAKLMAHNCGAELFLIWWPDRDEPRTIPAADWP